MPGVLPSSIRDFIGSLAAYIIPASLDILAHDLWPMAEPGPSTTVGQSASADSSSKGSRQGWSDAEIHTLIFYLHEHREKLSGGGFKDIVWTRLVKLLADKHHVTWSFSSLRTKFSEVHTQCNFVELTFLIVYIVEGHC